MKEIENLPKVTQVISAEMNLNRGRIAQDVRLLTPCIHPLRWRPYHSGMSVLTPHSRSAPFALLTYSRG